MLAEIIALLSAYKYWAIFPLALVEAPLMSIVIGFFAATGRLSLYPAFGIVVLGDFVGDTVLYVFGRWCRPAFAKHGGRIKFSHERFRKAMARFESHDRRAIVVSKLVHGIGFTGLIVAGSLRIPYSRFITTAIVVTILQSAVLAALGLFSGSAYQALARYLGYFDFFAGAVLVAILFVLYKSIARSADDAK